MSPRFTLSGLFLGVALAALVLAVVVPMHRHPRRLETHADRVVSVAGSADGSTFGALMGDGRVTIWDREGVLKGSLRPQESFGADLLLSSDGKLAAVWPGDSPQVLPRDEPHVWEVATRKAWRSFPIALVPKTFSPIDDLLLAVRQRPKPGLSPVGDEGQSYALQFPAPLEQLYAIDSKHPPRLITYARTAAFSPDGKLLAAVVEHPHRNDGIAIYAAADMRLVQNLVRPRGAMPVCNQLAWAPDSKSIVTMCSPFQWEIDGNETLEKYDLATGQVRSASLRGGRVDLAPSQARVVAYLPDGHALLVGAVALGFTAIDASTLEPLPATVSNLWDVAAGMRGDRFIAAESRAIDLWDVKTLRPRKRLFEAEPAPSYRLPTAGLVVWLIVYVARRGARSARLKQASSMSGGQQGPPPRVAAHGGVHVLLFLPLFCPAGAWARDESANPLFRQLLEHGVEIDQKQTIKLPKPSLPEGLVDPEQKQVIERLVSKKYSYDQFVRKSPVAPFLLEMHSSSIRQEPDALGGDPPQGKSGQTAGRVQHIDLWFVAYGDLQTVSDKELMSKLFSGERSSRARSEPLTDDELLKRDLQARDDNDLKESYFRIELPVLEKVTVNGIVHAATSRSDGLAVAAALLDPKLADDAQYPSRWRPITRSESGDARLGEPRPYAGLGGYCRATALQEPAGAMFVECHLVFIEPHGWFNGTNLLRSKLPLVVQDSVRTFRRKLTEAK